MSHHSPILAIGALLIAGCQANLTPYTDAEAATFASRAPDVASSDNPKTKRQIFRGLRIDERRLSDFARRPYTTGGSYAKYCKLSPHYNIVLWSHVNWYTYGTFYKVSIERVQDAESSVHPN